MTIFLRTCVDTWVNADWIKTFSVERARSAVPRYAIIATTRDDESFQLVFRGTQSWWHTKDDAVAVLEHLVSSLKDH